MTLWRDATRSIPPQVNLEGPLEGVHTKYPLEGQSASGGGGGDTSRGPQKQGNPPEAVYSLQRRVHPLEGENLCGGFGGGSRLGTCGLR